ncbi:MAG: hypothetical protein QF632_06025 [Candidatus Woesearchaeota archaeon]|jgi:hypothetical protein|nr:hypothetical protein [Candidatus Woesearchaeota archaeon]MDP7324290.1 hypothetical protein [Candidatus Woesearchaeota archaeon]MDP7457274.1 hypothetical protein [Candidatus Woesearchaeota archaeon]
MTNSSIRGFGGDVIRTLYEGAKSVFQHPLLGRYKVRKNQVDWSYAMGLPEAFRDNPRVSYHRVGVLANRLMDILNDVPNEYSADQEYVPLFDSSSRRIADQARADGVRPWQTREFQDLIRTAPVQRWLTDPNYHVGRVEHQWRSSFIGNLLTAPTYGITKLINNYIGLGPTTRLDAKWAMARAR